jgi:hypothetical protein
MRTKRIEKKTWSEFFEKVKNEEKTFDLRLADFHCQKGDILILREWDPKLKQYTGRILKKKVSFVLKTKDLKFFKKSDIEKYGFQVIGFKKSY